MLIDLGYLMIAFISSSYKDIRFQKCENILKKLEILEKEIQDSLKAQHSPSKVPYNKSLSELAPANFINENSSKNLENILWAFREKTDGNTHSEYPSDSSNPLTPKEALENGGYPKKISFDSNEKSDKYLENKIVLNTNKKIGTF